MTEGQDFNSTEIEPIEGQNPPFISCGAQACLLFSVSLMGQLADSERRGKVGRSAGRGVVLGRRPSFSGHRRFLE